MKRIIIVLGSILLLAPVARETYADRMTVPFKPHVKVFEPNQNAMVAWNGKEEILLLTTDLKASEKTKAIEVLPLPSEPQVKKGDPEVFKRAVRLINSKTRRWVPTVQHKKGALGLSRAKETPPAGEVTFHDKIGSHDISVTRVLNKEGFVEWVEKYLKSAGADNPQIPESLKEGVEGYTQAGFTWFVFDVVELGETIGSTEAIQYRFATKSLFYPLKISSSMEGDSRVKLLALTGCHILLKNDVGVSWVKPHRPIAVRAVEAIQIDRDMAALFGSGKNMMLRIWEFQGSLSSFKSDVIGESLKYPAGGLGSGDELLDELIRSKRGEPLAMAAREGDLSEVRKLMDLGINVDGKGGYPYETALNEAVSGGFIDIVNLLLKHGADVNRRTTSQITPLMYAALYGRIEITKALVRKGADVNAQDSNGMGALHRAAQKGHEEIVKFLSKHGSDVNAKASGGQTALQLAEERGHVGAVRLLKSYGGHE